jgi:hypothetical protein
VDKPSGNLSQNVHCGQFVGTHQVQQFFAISWNFTAVLKNKKYLKVEHGQNSICLFSVMKHFEEILSTVFERIFMGLLVGSFHTKLFQLSALLEEDQVICQNLPASCCFRPHMSKYGLLLIKELQPKQANKTVKRASKPRITLINRISCQYYFTRILRKWATFSYAI